MAAVSLDSWFSGYRLHLSSGSGYQTQGLTHSGKTFLHRAMFAAPAPASEPANGAAEE